MTVAPTHADRDWLKRFRKTVAERLDELTATVEEELGKPAFETLTSELVPLLVACRWHEKHARRWLRPRRLRGGSLWQLGQSHRLHRVPWGRVAIIATWNYPLQLLGVQLVQAVMAGNAVVVKPSERCPKSQGLLLEMARAAGMNEARLSWTDADRAAGAKLLEEMRFDHVVFTGSTAVGRQIAERLASTLTPSTLELSGCDSALVLHDADVELAAASIVYALSLNAGATCMVPRRVIVSGAKFVAFVEAIRQQIAGGSALDSYIQADWSGARSAAREAVAGGGRWLDEAMDGEGWCRPLVVVEAPCEGKLAVGEHFGPALAVIRAEDDAQARAIHHGFDQHLATTVFTKSPHEAAWVNGTSLLTDGGGIVTVNDCVLPSAHPAAPLAGHGPSGWGVTRGGPGLQAMTRPVVVSQTGKFPRTPLRPPSEKTKDRIRRFVKWRYG
ncbi:MAG: aldehyde dehydrogenase family protein [Planctomycetota bacterium]